MQDFLLILQVNKNNIVCKKNGILLPKLFWPTVRKNSSSDWEKLKAEGQEFAKITRTIYSNSESSEEF